MPMDGRTDIHRSIVDVLTNKPIIKGVNKSVSTHLLSHGYSYLEYNTLSHSMEWRRGWFSVWRSRTYVHRTHCIKSSVACDEDRIPLAQKSTTHIPDYRFFTLCCDEFCLLGRPIHPFRLGIRSFRIVANNHQRNGEYDLKR